ncbi:MAG: hypothetical protein KAW19_09960 [Candidatus Aminicenantes bacterium]|nr:hypothetical protein [Candidatus Aminicenantes bacterium]
MKKFIVFLGICLICVNCGQKFNDAIATAVIQEVFELSEDDVIEILGTSMESKNIALVKFKVNEVHISSKMRRYDKGWQIDLIRDELGKWIPAETIINFIAKQGKKNNQLIAMKNIVIISTAIVDYVTDNGIIPAQDGIYSENSEIYKALVPFYLESFPTKDPWGNNYLIYCGKAGNREYGLTGCVSDDFVVVSYGKDGEKESWEFNATRPEAGIFVVNTDDDYDKDLVMWNGSWIRGPRR